MIIKDRACDRCRKRKVKCLRISDSRCECCSKADIDCTFIIKSKRIQTPKALQWVYQKNKFSRTTLEKVQNIVPTPSTYLNNDEINKIHEYFFEEMKDFAEMIFRPKFYRNYQNGLQITRCLAYSIWAVVHLSRGQLLPAERYYQHAESMLNKLFDASDAGVKVYNSITALQTLCLIADCETRMGKTVKSSLTLAKAVKLSQMKYYDSLDKPNSFISGLDTKNEDLFQDEIVNIPNWVLREEIRRTFFKVYCYDKYSSLSRNIVNMFVPSQIHTELPSHLNLEFLYDSGDENIADQVKTITTMHIGEAVEAIKRGEILLQVSPFGIHVVLITFLHEMVYWLHDTCINYRTDSITDQKMDKIFYKMNQFCSTLDSNSSSFTAYATEDLNTNILTIYVSKLRMFQGMIMLFTKILKENPTKFTASMNNMYLDIKFRCTITTLEMLEKFDKSTNLINLLGNSPFYCIALNQGMKSVIQLAIISKQPKCDHIDAILLSKALNQMLQLTSVFEKSKSKDQLTANMVDFYNLKLASFGEDPYELVYFQNPIGI